MDRLPDNFLNRTAGLVLAGTALLTSSSPQPAWMDQPQFIRMTNPAAAERCLQPVNPQAYAARLACQRSGVTSMAVVDFSTLPHFISFDPRVVAKEVSTGLYAATDEVLALQPTVIEASPAAVKLVLATNAGYQSGKGCFSTAGNTHSLMAESAQQAMPELAGYDRIVALGGMSCVGTDESTNGAAYLNYKFADIYANDPAYEGGTYNQNLTELQAGIIDHELLHTDGLNHASSLDCAYTSGRYPIGMPLINLVDYMAKDCIYDEYGDVPNVMSGESLAVGAARSGSLSDIQRDYLRSKYGLISKSTAFEPSQPGQVVELDASQKTGPRYLRLPIGTLAQTNINSKVTDLSYLNLLPISDERTGKAHSVQVVLSSDFASNDFRIVRLMSLDLTTEARTVVLGQNQIKISRNKYGNLVLAVEKIAS